MTVLYGAVISTRAFKRTERRRSSRYWAMSGSYKRLALVLFNAARIILMSLVSKPFFRSVIARIMGSDSKILASF